MRFKEGRGFSSLGFRGTNPVGKLAGLDIPVTPDSHEAAITEPVAHFLDPMVVDIRPVPGSSNYYFYQHITGQIISINGGII